MEDGPTSASSRDVRAATGVEVGDVLTIDLERDQEERTVDLPADLEAVLDPTTRAAFDGLSFTHRREYVRWIESAKREQTRQRRVARRQPTCFGLESRRRARKPVSSRCPRT